MILMRILPGFLKELSKHIPAVLFQTVSWSELASEFPKISRRILQNEGYEELFTHHKELLASSGLELKESLHGEFTSSRSIGEKILLLYFAQIYSPKGIFLDLSSHYFASNNETLIWHPGSLWTQFDEKFRHGLMDVYEGFYLENEELYLKGLEGIGLLQKDFSSGDKKVLADLFRAQFGNGLHEDIQFELDHLNQSIIKMSEFMLNKKVNISKDFLYLGIYLVTLYSTLETINEKLPVKEIYLKSRANFLTSTKS